MIRATTEADLPAITAIDNDAVATPTAIHGDEPFRAEDRAAWFAARRAAGYPLLVADDGDGVPGRGTLGDCRAYPGYRRTAGHSVHVRADAPGRGLGSSLVAALFEPARALGRHVMAAAVDASNGGSIHMHERLGFTHRALLREAGRTFGRWLDAQFMQAFPDAPGALR